MNESLGSEALMPCTCAECGYLSTTDARTGTGALEVDKVFRATGNPRSALTYCSGNLHCFALSRAFPDEPLRIASSTHQGVADQLAVLIDCANYQRWWPGLSPKEHLKRELGQREIDRQLEWQIKQERERREWEKTQERRSTRWRVIEVAIVLLVSVAAQIVAAFIDRGSLFAEKPVTTTTSEDSHNGRPTTIGPG